MEINKKRIIIIIATTIVIFAIAFFSVYWYNHPTHYLFEDRWIIGKDANQIKQRYGEFDKEFGGSSKGYCVKPEIVGYFGTTWPEYYMIYFDENGDAYKVEIVEGGWGG